MHGNTATRPNSSLHGLNRSPVHCAFDAPSSTTSPQWTTKFGRRSHMSFATFPVTTGLRCVSPTTVKLNASPKPGAVMNVIGLLSAFRPSPSVQTTR